MLRNRTILAFVASLGLLLHASTAAATMWCMMTGSLSTACCCEGSEREEGMTFRVADDCCLPVAEAPTVDSVRLASLPMPTPALPWAEVLPPEPPAAPAYVDAPRVASPPLVALATIVLLR